MTEVLVNMYVLILVKMQTNQRNTISFGKRAITHKNKCGHFIIQ